MAEKTKYIDMSEHLRMEVALSQMIAATTDHAVIGKRAKRSVARGLKTGATKRSLRSLNETHIED